MTLMRNLTTLCCFLVVLSGLSSAAFAQDAAERLRKELDAMSTLKGDFEQTTLDSAGKVQETSLGNFMLMRPGKFYWKTIEPMPQLLVSNNKTIWLYDPDLETVTQRAFSDDLRQTPALLLSAAPEALNEQFSISHRAEKATNIYVLTPKVTEGMFEQLTLVFGKQGLTEFSITDGLGQVTRCVLINTSRNQTLPEELFHFIPPEGVDVLVD